MRRKDLLDEIVKYSSRFIEEVKQYNSIGLYDINIHSENFLIPVLGTLLGLNLENLNSIKKKNYPSLDLADFKNRVGIQISSTSSNEKITETLEKFKKHNLSEYFDIIYFFFLSDKKKKYPQEKFSKLVEGHLEFNCKDHVLDNNDLLGRLSNQPLENLKYLARIYKHEFSDIQLETREKHYKSGYLENERELLYSNLIKIEPPEFIFSADLFLDEELILNRINIERESKGWKRIKRINQKAKLLRNELIYQGHFERDWILRNGRIFTFRNLNNSSEALSNYIDQGTLEEYNSSEYFSENEDYKRNFTNLLRNSLIEDCGKIGLEWVNDKKILRFRINKKNKGVKQVSWTAKNKATKTVIFELKNKEKGHIICYKHLAFKPSFELLENGWHLIINSTWSFTNPGGKKRSRFEDKYLSGIKRLESNKAVYYFYRFWSYYLTYTDLFSPKNKLLDLQLIEPLTFSPRLIDLRWLPGKETSTNEDENISIDTELIGTLFE